MTDLKNIEFVLPEPISEFIFDLHQATRKAFNVAEVQKLYDVKFKELSEKYFSQSPWPSPKHVAPECYFDDDFLLFYREMTLRHLFSKQKPTLNDHLEAWSSYTSLFDFLINSKKPDIIISTVWANEIVQEFVYHFQDFCQYRAQVSTRSEDEIQKLQANKEVWSLPEMIRILNGLAEVATPTPSSPSPEPLHQSLGYFSVVETARLECLLGDYTASLRTVSPKRLVDRSELFNTVPTCHANAYYHAGVCLLMSRKYTMVIDILSEAILQITRQLKPGAAVLRQSVQQALQKTLDKIMALTAISIALSPGHRGDDQVLELIDAKWSDKARRMQGGELTAFEDLFEGNCPKFISPAWPDFNGTVNPCQEAVRSQVALFSSETLRQISLVKLRSFLRLYSSIDVGKMASLNDTKEAEFTSKLLSYKSRSKLIAEDAVDESCGSGVVPQSDVHCYIELGNLIIDSVTGKNDKSRSAERYFISGVRKHAEICNDLSKSFAKWT